MRAFFIFLLLLILVSGCIGDEKEIAKNKCIALCKEFKNNGTDLSNGPCLSNEIIEDWVCDVAHWPRLDVDNDPRNQCPAFGKTARHFVEVDPNCNFIRAF